MKCSVYLTMCLMALTTGIVVAVEDEPIVGEGAKEEIGQPLASSEEPILEIDLDACLHLAHTQGRAKQAQEEELELLEESLHNTWLDYTPRPSGSVGANWSDDGYGNDSLNQNLSLALSQRLPTAGSISLSTSISRDEDDNYTRSGSVSISQPLLKGAGLTVWREGLTQAQRSHIYALRAHQEFLQELSLNTARSFWSLLRSQHGLTTRKNSLERAHYLFEQSEAFLSIGRTKANDVFRAKSSLLQEEQALVDALAAFEVQVDAFKIDLALDVDTELMIQKTPPRMVLLTINSKLAIETALSSRLSWLTLLDRFEDTRRALTLARNNLLPSLNLSASAQYGDSNDGLDESFAERPSYSAGLQLELPLDRRSVRLSYHRSLVAVERGRRDLEVARQRIIQEVVGSIRDLRTAEHSLQLQERLQHQSSLRLEKSLMDYESGLISNRDYVEAQGEVRNANTAYFNAIIDYRIAELNLRRQTGVLRVDPHGQWAEEWPLYAKEKDRVE